MNQRSGDTLVDFYSRPQLGGGLAVFQGTRRQIGGSFLSSLARFAIPILKFLGRKALGVAGNVAADVLTKNVPLRESITRRGKEGLSETITDARKQTGLGGARRKRPLTMPPSFAISSAKKRKKMDINTSSPPPLPPNVLFK